MVKQSTDTLKRKLIAEVIDREGGYVNRATDRGGPTKYGITEATARANNWTGRIQDITLEFAAKVYGQRYWVGPRIGDVAERDQLVAMYLFDWGVNSGPGHAAKSLQSYLNIMNNRQRLYADISVDGAIGSMTLNTLDTYIAKRGRHAIRNLRADVNANRLVFCRNIAVRDESQEEYTYGWYNRIVELVVHTEDATPVPIHWLEEVDTL